MPEVRAIDLGDFVPWLASGVFAVEWNTLYVTFDHWRTRDAYPPTEQAAEVPNAEEPPAPIATTAPPPQATWKWADGKRQGRSRAIIIPEGEATARDAASLTKLDPTETAKWLKDPTGHWMGPDEKVQAGTEYSVSNTFVIGIGSNDELSNQWLDRWQKRLSTALAENGVFVETYRYPDISREGMIEAIVKPDVWGFALFGHGNVIYTDTRYSKWDSAWIIDRFRGYFPSSIAPHVDNGSFLWDVDKSELITTTLIQKDLHHRFGLEVIYCFTNLHPWHTLVAIEDNYHGGYGPILPHGGAWSLGYPSWSALVKDTLQ